MWTTAARYAENPVHRTTLFYFCKFNFWFRCTQNTCFCWRSHFYLSCFSFLSGRCSICLSFNLMLISRLYVYAFFFSLFCLFHIFLGNGHRDLNNSLPSMPFATNFFPRVFIKKEHIQHILSQVLIQRISYDYLFGSWTLECKTCCSHEIECNNTRWTCFWYAAIRMLIVVVAAAAWMNCL